MARALQAGLRNGGLRRGGLRPGLGEGNLFSIASLDLNFAAYKNLGSLVTFTRASSGTFVGSDGVLKTAVTNLLLRSEEFDNASWAKDFTTATANVAVAPNGATTADKVAEDSSNNFHAISQYVTGFASGAIVIFSVYAKAAGRTKFRIQTDAAAGSGTTDFNLSSVSVDGQSGIFSNGSIVPVGNDWYRCSVRCTTSSAGPVGLKIILSQSTYGTAYTGDGTSGLFIWGAQLEQSTTVGEYIPTTSVINSAPRFDHNPTTGESLGLLVEEARTNSIANNTGVGVVAGTPGTLPTNWSWNPTGGASTEVVGTGTENGIAYVDVRLFGTLSSSPSIQFVANTAIAAATGQTWTESVYCKIISLVSGTPDPRLRITERSAAGVYLTEGNQVFTPGISSASLIASRSTFTRTLTNALTGYVVPAILFGQASGAIDITLRIGLPQLEQGAFATSVIPTTSATVTRAADVASITGSNFSSWYNQTEGTLYIESTKTPIPVTTSTTFADLNDGTTNNRSRFWIWSGATSTLRFTPRASNVDQADLTIGTPIQNIPFKAAGSLKANDFAAVLNGGTVSTDGSGTVPTVDRLSIGNSGSAIEHLGGTIKRLTYWPTRLSNTTLQAISQP